MVKSNVSKIQQLNWKPFLLKKCMLSYGNCWMPVSNDYIITSIGKIGCTTIHAQTLLYVEKSNIEDFKQISNKHAITVMKDFFTKSSNYKVDPKIDLRKKVALFRDPIERVKSAYRNLFNNFNIVEFTMNVEATLSQLSSDEVEHHINLQCNHYDFDDVDIFVELKDYPKFCEENNIPWIQLNQSNSKNVVMPSWCEDILIKTYAKDYELIKNIKQSGKLWVMQKK